MSLQFNINSFSFYNIYSYTINIIYYALKQSMKCENMHAILGQTYPLLMSKQSIKIMPPVLGNRTELRPLHRHYESCKYNGRDATRRGKATHHQRRRQSPPTRVYITIMITPRRESKCISGSVYSIASPVEWRR